MLSTRNFVNIECGDKANDITTKGVYCYVGED